MNGGSASWAFALKEAYRPFLRGLSIDNCNASPRTCHLERALRLLELAEDALRRERKGRESTKNADSGKASGKAPGKDSDETAPPLLTLGPNNDHSNGEGGRVMEQEEEGRPGGGGWGQSEARGSSRKEQQVQMEQMQMKQQQQQRLERPGSSSPYIAIVLMQPDLVLLPAGPSLVAGLMRDHAASFKWPCKQPVG